MISDLNYFALRTPEHINHTRDRPILRLTNIEKTKCNMLIKLIV